MTIPHLMNCAHTDDGWCAECVMKLGNERDELREELERLRAQEPVGHVHSDGEFCWDKKPPHEWWPIAVYSAPPAQPAEPVQRLSDDFVINTMRFIRSNIAGDTAQLLALAASIESAIQPQWRPEWSAFLEYWTHESHLQTFGDRERFRAAAKAMIEVAPKASHDPR
jgi:hypothetical protein